MQTLLIQNSLVLLPEGNLQTTDVLVRQGKIVQIAENITDPADRVLDGEGLTLLPGVIDPQVHFREPGLEHKEDLQTASYACAHGGVTSFLEMPNTRPLTISQEALDDKLYRASQKSIVNYGFFIGATATNLQVLQTAQPTCGVKIFMGSMKGDLLIDRPSVLEEIFAQVPRLIAVHAEDQERIMARRQELLTPTPDPSLHSIIQDNTAALLATQRAVQLSLKYQRRLHILHLSTQEEVAYLRSHKTPWITAEVTPQHLFLNTSAYATIGTLAQMNPPLRSPADNQALWAGLQDGILDFIATDHAPHTLEEKAQPYPQSPSGMPGVETSLPLMLTAVHEGKCRLDQVSHWMSRNVAQAYGIPAKGEIRIGWDADLVLVNRSVFRPVTRTTLQTRCGWSPFEGWLLTGYPEVTIVNGNIVYEKGTIFVQNLGKPLQFRAVV